MSRPPPGPPHGVQGNSWRAVLEHVAQGVLLANRQGRFVHWNPAALRMHGFASAEDADMPTESLRGLYVLTTLDGQPVAPDQTPLSRALRGEVLEDFTLNVRRTDRVWERVLAFSGGWVTGLSGEEALVQLCVTDVTGRVAAERRLREERDRAALLLRCSQVLEDAADLRVALPQLAYLLETELGLEVCCHYRLVPPRALELTWARGLAEASLLQARACARKGFSGLFLESREGAVDEHGVLPCSPDDATAFLGDAGVRAYVCHPLSDGEGHLLGVLLLASRHHAALVPGAKETLRRLAAQLSVAKERHRQRLQLSRMDGQFRQLAQSVPQLIFTTDEQGRVDGANTRVEEFSGVAAELLLGDGWLELVAPEDRPGVQREWRKARAEHRALERSVRLVDREDALRWFNLAAVPADRAEPHDGRWIITLSDIHELRTTRDQLAEREAAMKLLIQQLPIVVWTLDRDLRSTSMKGGGNASAGYREEDVRGRLLSDLLAQAPYRERMMAACAQALEGEATALEVSRGDRVFEYVVSPLRDPQQGIVGVAGLSVDVTEKRAAERALRHANEQLRTAQRVGNYGSWEVDLGPDGRPNGEQRWSEHMHEVAGIPRDQKVTMATLLDLMHPEDRVPFEGALGWWNRGAEEHVHQVRTRPLVQGQWRVLLIHARVIRDAATGVPLRVVGTAQDVTARAAAEEEVRRLNTQLEQRVASRTAELSAANAELESFAYAVAHDLRAPLRSMSGFSQILLEDHAAALPAEAQEHLHRISRAAANMGSLMDGLLRLSRQTRAVLNVQKVDLTAMALALLADLAAAEPQRRVTVDVEQALTAQADPTMMQVVLQNLLGNAWKYTARVPHAHIRVSATRHHPHTVFCVEDDGAGFDMAHARRLFTPFNRLHRQDEFPGTGLGLATVQRILRRHGGDILAESQPGMGARFFFWLLPGSAIRG